LKSKFLFFPKDTMMQPAPMSLQSKTISNREVVKEHFLMRLELPTAFPQPFPGQFVMIRSMEVQGPLQARPMSIYNFERGEKQAFLEIFYRIAGIGTRGLSRLKTGAEVNVVGPLGQGYSLNPDTRNVILIAGGIGVSPLTFLAASLNGLRRQSSIKVTAYIGAQHQGVLAGLERLATYCPDIRTCTDDGSAGYCGMVTDLFERELSCYPAADSFIYACGPPGMMKRLAELLRGHPLPCQVSLEERMACGLGACLGCAVPVRTAAGDVAFQRVCKEGPVFDIRQIFW